jgi:hypothetical protein
MKSVAEDLDHRFAYHQPSTSNVIASHSTVRNCCKDTASIIVQLCPPGRELALALTHLEEAMMWANAAIARDQESADQLAKEFVRPRAEPAGYDPRLGPPDVPGADRSQFA